MSKKMTPCEELGYKVGDKFEVISHYAFKKCQVVTLHTDDGTKTPLFAGDGGRYGVIDGVETSYAILHAEVKPITNKLKPAKQALADAINQNGGWPESELLDFATSNAFGEVLCSASHPERKGNVWVNGDYYRLISCIKGTIANWHQTVLSRDEYYQAYPKADADGWIEWSGGECPVYGDDEVDVVLVGGSTNHGIADEFDWHRDGGPLSVASYRLHKPEFKPELCESVTRSIPEPEAKPTIEQLAADYRNAKGYADRKQDEADKASMESDAALSQLEDAIAAIGFVITPLAATVKEPELVAAVKVGDQVGCVESNIKRDKYNGMVGRLHFIDESDTSTPYLVDFGGAEKIWCHEVKFIRRP